MMYEITYSGNKFAIEMELDEYNLDILTNDTIAENFEQRELFNALKEYGINVTNCAKWGDFLHIEGIGISLNEDVVKVAIFLAIERAKGG